MRGNRENTPEQLFSLGQVLATPRALRTMAAAGEDPLKLLWRHVTGDRGELTQEDEQKRFTLRADSRILSAYDLENGERVLIITEVDRRATTILVPGEY